MMQSCASVARLLGGGPILSRGTQAMGYGGSPPPRIVLTLCRGRAGSTPNLSNPLFAPVLLRLVAQIGATFSLAPAGTSPVVT